MKASLYIEVPDLEGGMRTEFVRHYKRVDRLVNSYRLNRRIARLRRPFGRRERTEHVSLPASELVIFLHRRGGVVVQYW